MVSSPALPHYRCFVGVDIAAASFTAVWTADGRALPRATTFAQSPTGFATFQRQLQATGCAPAQTLVVLEATGSYWVALAVTLHDAGYAVAVVNPAHLHNYAQSLPRRGKTDALDAQVCLRFASERQYPLPREPAVDATAGSLSRAAPALGGARRLAVHAPTGPQPTPRACAVARDG